MVKVFSTGRPDTGSWYKIWQAAEAMFAVCTRFSRFGSFRGLGRLSYSILDDWVWLTFVDRT